MTSSSSSTAQARLAAIQKTLTPPFPPNQSTSQNPPFPFPVPNATIPFWRTELHPLDSHRSTAELPEKCEIVVIGAGFSGASLTHHLLEGNDGAGESIVILEARESCSGATGRNGGHLKPDVYFNIPKYKKMFGDEMATEIAKFESSQVFAVKDLVEKEKIDCEFHLTRAVDTCLDQTHADKCKAEFDILIANGEPSTRDVHYAAGKDAEALSGVIGAKGAFSFTAGHIWPYKMVMHLLQRAVDRGVNLQTNTPVLSISENPSEDGYYSVKTQRGILLAKTIVLATNAYTSSLAPEYSSRIIPVRGICTRINVPEGTTAPYLPNTHSVRHGPGLYDYQIPRMDGSIIVGGGRKTFWDDTTQWYNVTDDTTLIEPAVEYFKDDMMQKTYRGWENSGAKLDMAWTGIMGYTTDLMPHIGAIPGKPNQYVCAGFNGHGMPLILLAAKGVAKMIREGCEFKETGIPVVFQTTEARLKDASNAILESKPQ
ncbi:FAD dependent oxidoreductase [Cadophora sp. MPI-SDFR-AT-0126]|nr:FAD dependent oxidoreductase [Leotiomycetes sp. MPI-SDFR-AT-0126]